MFLSFDSQEKRREYGGSSYVELQFCKMPLNSKIESIVAVDDIKNWQLDSLYINEYEDFSMIYGSIFDCGIYSNMQQGAVDIYGINYYKPELIGRIISKINNEKPKDYLVLLKWLEDAKNYNGCYILGV